MLRNSFLEHYQTQRKKISEFEKEMLDHDENHLLNLQRPLSARGIEKLPNNILQSFIDDIMCNKKINKLLYSSNEEKELLFYLKQKNFILKNTKVYIKRNPFSLKKNIWPCESVFLKKKKDAMFQIIKENISEYKNNKNISMKRLKSKNNSFHKKQTKMDKIISKLYFKSINDIRLQGYKKAVEDCLNKSNIDKNFSIPDISFNMNDPYSRLYHNAILKPIKLKDNEQRVKTMNDNIKKMNLSEIRKGKEENKIDDNNNSKTLLYKRINKTKIKNNNNIDKNSFIFNKKIINKSIINGYNSYYINNKKKLPLFNLKKILEGSDGKEFSVKPSLSVYSKCWSNNSGGPKIKKQYYKKILKNILGDDGCVNDSKEIVDINSYRDEENNSNLIIAVKRNNERFVKYFLEKKYSPNDQNKYGNTALHFAMKNNNKEIIKLLMDKDADISIKNNKGITPYDLASKEVKNEFKLDNILILKETKKYYY